MDAKGYIFYLYENSSLLDRKLGETSEKILNTFLRRKICSAYQCYKDLSLELSKEGKSITYKNVHEPVQKLFSYNLIKRSMHHFENPTKHGAVYYTLTSFGIFYLMKNRRIWDLNFILEHDKNELFNLLLYPFIKFETIRSLTDPEIIHLIFMYLIKCCQEIENWYFTRLRYVEELGGMITGVISIEGISDPQLADIKYNNDPKSFIEFLRSEFDIQWLDKETSKITEVEKYKLFRISDPKHTQKELLLHLNPEAQEAILSEKNKEVIRFVLRKGVDQEYHLLRFWPYTVKEFLDNGPIKVERLYFSSIINELFLKLLEYNVATPYYQKDEKEMHDNFRKLILDEHFMKCIKSFKEEFDSNYSVFINRINMDLDDFN